jgi:hypothetical protein
MVDPPRHYSYIPVSPLADDLPEPHPTMAQWIDEQADHIRGLDSDLATWLADKIAALAVECQDLDATTPEDFEDRSMILARDFAERENPDFYPPGYAS